VTSQQNGNKSPKDKYCKTKVHITIHRKRTERIDEIGKWPCIIVKKAISIKEKKPQLINNVADNRNLFCNCQYSI